MGSGHAHRDRQDTSQATDAGIAFQQAQPATRRATSLPLQQPADLHKWTASSSRDDQRSVRVVHLGTAVSYTVTYLDAT